MMGDWQIFASAVLSYICSCFEKSTLEGQNFLQDNEEVLSMNLYPSCMPASQENLMDLKHDLITPVVRLLLENNSRTALCNILKLPSLDQIRVIQTVILQCSLYGQIRPRGLEVAEMFWEIESELDTIAPLSTKLEEWIGSLKQHFIYESICEFVQELKITFS